MLKRYYDNLVKHTAPGKVLVIYGPRRVGKTTLLNNYLAETNLKYRLDSGDNIRVREIINSSDFDRILDYVEGYKLLVIDEAQQITGIGMGLKIIVDQRPDITVVVTGSSSFDLANKVGEPLTGRKKTITLFPLSQLELSGKLNRHELKEKLEDFLIFGSYPEVITAKTKKKKIEVLEELVGSYLLKDVLAFERIKNPDILLNLLKLLALQLGSEVSHNELAISLKVNVRTVTRYIDLLEKSFIIYKLGGFSRNLRKELAKKNKYYFYDNGIRNAIIMSFNKIELRNDVGPLWENFLIMERQKKNAYKGIYGSSYFWRTYEQKEIDLIEERDGILHGYEFKWKEGNYKPPIDFLEAYKGSKIEVISKDNYLDFVM